MRLEIKYIPIATVVACGLLGSSSQGCNLAAKLSHPTPLAATATPHAMAQQTTPMKEPKITGLWLQDTVYEGQVIDRGFESIYADGNELVIDTSAPSTDNVCSGVWDQTKPLTFEVNHPAWDFDPVSQVLLAIVVIRDTIVLDPGGNSYTGTVTFNVYDPVTGAPLQPEQHATLKGTRITVASSPL